MRLHGRAEVVVAADPRFDELARALRVRVAGRAGGPPRDRARGRRSRRRLVRVRGAADDLRRPAPPLGRVGGQEAPRRRSRRAAGLPAREERAQHRRAPGRRAREPRQPRSSSDPRLRRPQRRAHPRRPRAPRRRAVPTVTSTSRGCARAGCAAAIFAVFTPSAGDEHQLLERDDGVVEVLPAAEVTHDYASGYATAAAGRLVELERGGHVRIARTASDLDAARADDGPPAAVLHLEGAEAIDPEPRVARSLVRRPGFARWGRCGAGRTRSRTACRSSRRRRPTRARV